MTRLSLLGCVLAATFILCFAAACHSDSEKSGPNLRADLEELIREEDEGGIFPCKTVYIYPARRLWESRDRSSKVWRIGGRNVAFPNKVCAIEALKADFDVDGKDELLVLAGPMTEICEGWFGVMDSELYLVRFGRARLICNVGFGEDTAGMYIINLNNDQYPDLVVEHVGGSWMPKTVLNFSEKHLRPRKIFHDAFWGAEDVDGDGIREIIVQDMMFRCHEDWPGPEDWRLHPFVRFVYKWDGRRYPLWKMEIDWQEERRSSPAWLLSALLNLQPGSQKGLTDEEADALRKVVEERHREYTGRELTAEEVEKMTETIQYYVNLESRYE